MSTLRFTSYKQFDVLADEIEHRGKQDILAASSFQNKKAYKEPQVECPLEPLLDPLSVRELEVLQLLAQGASNAEIADALVIAFATVKRHVSNILSKLQANNRTQAVAYARRLSLLN